MIKQNKRKSAEGVTDAVSSPKKVATPKKEAQTPKPKTAPVTPKPKKGAATPKPKKGPVTPKAKNGPATPKSNQKKVPKKATTNGAAKGKKSPKPRLTLIPKDLADKLNRRQKKRVIHKLAEALKQKGTENFSTIDPNDASVKEILDNLVLNEDTTEKKVTNAEKTKNKFVKKVVAAAEAEAQDDTEAEKETKVKAKTPRKTPKKSPKAK